MQRLFFIGIELFYCNAIFEKEMPQQKHAIFRKRLYLLILVNLLQHQLAVRKLYRVHKVYRRRENSYNTQ